MILLLILSLGHVLIPIIASTVLAFLMQGVIARLAAVGARPWLAMTIAYGLFITLFFGVIILLLPLVWQQLVTLVQELPTMLRKLQQVLMLLPERVCVAARRGVVFAAPLARAAAPFVLLGSRRCRRPAWAL